MLHQDENTNEYDDRRVVPFLKWAGGKRWLVSQHLDLFPNTYERYIEPFLGGGSVFFALQPDKSILADSNSRLIETYAQVRDRPLCITKLLRKHQEEHSDEYYYTQRSRKYSDSAVHRAAQFIYLNRTCWNGLYRVNLRGEFNVPKGTKKSVLLATDDFEAVARTLRNATLRAQDYSVTMSCAAEGDLVYVDPPYTVKNRGNGFAKYNEKIFRWQDQVHLRNEVKKAIGRGALVVVSNSDHQSIKDLYCDVGVHLSVTRQSIIAGESSFRGSVQELLIRSWNPESGG